MTHHFRVVRSPHHNFFLTRPIATDHAAFAKFLLSIFGDAFVLIVPVTIELCRSSFSGVVEVLSRLLGTSSFKELCCRSSFSGAVGVLSLVWNNFVLRVRWLLNSVRAYFRGLSECYQLLGTSSLKEFCDYGTLAHFRELSKSCRLSGFNFVQRVTQLWHSVGAHFRELSECF